MSKVVLALFLSLIATISFFAQQPASQEDPKQTIPKQINGGVVNGKAISLPKPPYPPAARAVGASGTVTVQVLIGENGDIESATALSGHPLLRAAAVVAAKGAKFSPTRLSGNPVKVSGVIVYNFVGPLYSARIGFVLGHAERSGRFPGYVSADSLASQFPADWIQEKDILKSLSYEKTSFTIRAEPQTVLGSATRKEDVVEGTPSAPRMAPVPKETERYSVASPADSVGNKLDARSVDGVRTLIAMVTSRAADAPSEAWAIELGQALAALAVDAGDKSKSMADLDAVALLIDRAPLEVNQTALKQVKTFVSTAKEGSMPEEELRQAAEGLANLRY